MSIAHSFKVVSQLSEGLLPLLVISTFLPILILIGLGFFALFEYGYFLHFIALLAICALTGIIPLWWNKYKRKPENIIITIEKSFVSASDSWGEYDNQVWNLLNQQILQQLRVDSDWSSLQQHALSLIASTAEQYHYNKKQKELAFSLPELLIMTEEVSRRYRLILETHVPFIENFSLSLLRQGYENKEKFKSGFKSATWIWNTWRVIRLTSPVAAIITEIRGQFLGKLFSHVNSEIQLKLKQALLQEVVSVSISLYSGRFKVDDRNLESSLSHQADKERIALPLDPLRICLIGQVSSGKSSIINALTKRMLAEINILPSTEEVTIYRCAIEGLDAISLVDLPGFDGQKSTEKNLLKEVTNCDLILWVLKANQPAKSLDTEFKKLLDDYYARAENQSLKRPTIIGILSQVDRLNPTAEWDPPYDLETPKSEKAITIKDAVDYNKEILDISTLVPMAVSDDRAFFNLEELEHLLDKNFNDGIQVQLNRRRIESTDSLELSNHAKRIFQTGRSLFKICKS